MSSRGDHSVEPRCEQNGEPVESWILKAVQRVDDLTSRQQDVLECLGLGMDTKDIASRLTLTEHTVKVHTSRVLQTLRVESRLQAGLVGYAYAACRGCRNGE